ncbi:MAG: hypothetical protein GXY11_01420 [Clostridiales bacterium]|nr:hypothetical protein [Clostridiales bacterium]
MGSEKPGTIKDVKTPEELRAYLRAKGSNHRNYLHYTNFAGLIGMVRSGYFHLSSGDRMNDRQELLKGSREVWKNTFIGSFAYGQNENMAMWGLYGLPWEDAVCIIVPGRQMNEWVDSIEEVYLIGDGATYEPAGKPSEAVLTDVAYVGEPQDGEFTVRRYDETLRVTEGTPSLRGINESARMTGYIKNDAWHYENEVRLRVHFKHRRGLGAVAVRFPEGLVEKMTVVFGPWAKENAVRRLEARIKEILKSENGLPGRESGYTGLVSYNTACRYCVGGAFRRAVDPLS